MVVAVTLFTIGFHVLTQLTVLIVFSETGHTTAQLFALRKATELDYDFISPDSFVVSRNRSIII